jgi:hypothetical protein
MQHEHRLPQKFHRNWSSTTTDMNLTLTSIGKNLEQDFSTNTYKIIHILHRSTHKDSITSSFDILRFLYYFLWIFKALGDLVHKRLYI